MEEIDIANPQPFGEYEVDLVRKTWSSVQRLFNLMPLIAVEVRVDTSAENLRDQ